MEENSEILAKYQKLALEYSKLKAQSSVLKAAVGDEQSTVADLQETVKKKDQLLRKLEQEVECLNFRNLQLTKRVSVLQNDLEGVDTSSKHSKAKHSTNHSGPHADSYGVLNMELQSRIEENERLHQQLYAIESEHKTEILELTSKVEKLQSDIADQEQKLSEKIKEQESLIISLQKEKIKMQVCIKNQEQELKERKQKEETKDQDVTSVKEDLTQQLQTAEDIIADKIVFNDTCVPHLNALNAPIIQRGKHGQLVSSMFKVQSFIYDFARQLSDLFAFMMQRLCTESYESSSRTITIKLDLYFRESISRIKVVPTFFEKVADSIKDESLTWDKSPILLFSNSFEKYILGVDQLLPYLILRIEAKESWTGSSPKSIELSPKLVAVAKRIVKTFKTLLRYVQLLATIGSSPNDLYYSTQPTVVKKILSNLKKLLTFFDEARKLFSAKNASDHQLPMYSASEKSTDECIASTLVTLSSTLKKITEIMEKELAIIASDFWYMPRNNSKKKTVNFNPYVWQYKDKGSKYIQHVTQNEFPSIPYEVALKNQQTLLDNSENHENLSQQLEQYRNKLMQLELDKENWMLECQLMKAKESQNSELTSSGNEQLTVQGFEEIHSYVKNTVNQLIKQIQYADSKSIAFRNECDALYQRLKMNIEKKESLEKEVISLKELVDQMKEEQKTLKESYEDQLNTMSEHLANLNETLTAQKDEIDTLKQANKGNKKGKGK